MQNPSLRQTLTDLNLTGELNRNTPESNRQAIREMIARNSYWTFDAAGIVELGLDYDRAAAVMAARLGMSVERFESDEVPFIDPDKTIDGLVAAFDQLEAAARAGQRVALVTAHPGSMLSFYAETGRYLQSLGATLCVPGAPVAAHDNRWIDSVDGVLVLSDEGNLMHTHNDHGMRAALADLAPDVVFGDHGFAMAGINLGVPTIAIFDVDDPALAMMAEFHPERVAAFPMNDNQTNARTVQAARSVIAERTRA